MATKKAYLFSSDVASFIGQNIWDYTTPFERLWKKVDATGYDSAITQMKNHVNEKKLEIEQVNLEKSHLLVDLQQKKLTKRQYDMKLKVLDKKALDINESVIIAQDKIDEVMLSQQQRLENVVGVDLITEMNSNDIETSTKRTRLNDAINELDMDERRKDKIFKAAESFINKTHGTLKENEAIDMFNKKYSVQLDTSQQFLKASVGRHLNLSFEWYVCGRVDGLYIDQNDHSNSYLVEVKNRTKSFFSNLREYEKTQIQLYMYMLNLQKAKLVEKLNDKIRVTDVLRDNEYISLVIKSLEIFLSNFENNFLGNEDVQSRYVALSNDEKKQFLRQLYIKDILSYKLSLFESESDDECMIDDL